MTSTLLIESLESLRRRVRLLAATYGLGLVLTAAVAGLVAAVSADWLLNLPAVPRAVLVLGAAGGVGYAAWRWLVSPLLARLSLNDVAGRVEQTYPQFQDRLRSTVDILTGRDLPGSDVMKQRVVSEATRLTQSLDLSRVVQAKPVWYSSAAATAAVVLLAVLVAGVGSDFTRLALKRLFVPFAAAAWPRTVEIRSVGDVPDRVTVGQRVDVNIKLERGDRASRRATIFYQYGDAAGHFGPVQQEYMARGDDGVYHATVDARLPESLAAVSTGQIKIWTESGDGRLDVVPVRVVQRLGLDHVEAAITPPAYAKQPPVRVSLTQPATMTTGSTVTITAAFNKPLSTSEPVTAELLSGHADALRWTAASPTSVSATFTAAESVRFHLHATDADGLKNTAAEEFELVVRPDQNPTVLIENPRRNEDRTPQATVPVQAVAEDDFDVSALSLVVDRLGDKKHWELPLVDAGAAVADVQWVRVDTTQTAGGGDLVRYRANYTWDLAKALPGADLKAGDTLEYFLSVRDNYALNGATHPAVASGHLRLNIISQEQLNDAVTNELRTAADQVATLKRGQSDTQRQTAELAKATAGKPQVDAADAVAADRLSGQQGTLASQAKSVATKMADVQKRLDENRSPNADLKNTAKDVKDLMDRAAEGPMKAAATSVAEAKSAPSTEAREQKFKDAQTDQGQSADTLQKALDRMGNVGSLSRTIEGLRNILAEQQKVSAETAAAGKATLGQTPEQMKPEDKAKLDKAAQKQQELADKTAKILDEMAKDAEKLAKSDPSASAAMKQASNTGQQQQVSPNQQKASKAASANQQSQAQSAQKAAELGLQMMMADLREAEKHKLDELNRKLAEVQQQVAVLIRRQAGHNLDTVARLGNDPAARMDNETRATLTEQAERDPQVPPPVPELAALSGGQEQTERNARDVAKAVEDLPDGSAPADRLTDAADQMERAIVHLRAEQLAAAYAPPQVKALDALLAAKRVIDEQKAKSDEKKDGQKKEAIRQQFMTIRMMQIDVNGKTTAIDGAPRNEDGSRRREDLVPLGQLPGKQGDVADRATKLDEPLAALNSVVYTWANRDLVKNMRRVKDDLGQQETGVAVQARQRQIVEELDSIIADLIVKPEQSKFAQKANGGGGGGGGGQSSPGLPSEAELRLLKDLQIAVNRSTESIAKAGKHEKAETLDLGGRQGDLRELLDKLIQKASKGQLHLPPEPDNRDQLPEEAAAAAAAKAGGDVGEKIDEQELQQDLIGPGAKPKPAGAEPAAAKKPGDKKADEDGGDRELALVGGRMGRSRQRLSMNDDPGAVTQEIQKRILDNLDDLIEQARKKQAQQQNSPPKPGEGQQQQAQAQPGQPQPGQPQPGPKGEGGQTPAQTASAGGNAAQKAAEGTTGKQDGRMWGQVAPRERQAVMEGQGEKVLDKYKSLVDDYYKAMSTRAKAVEK